MIQRCTNPNGDRWEDYGARGIEVCERWRSFVGFLADMGERPPGTSLDRIDVDGNYELANCRWATREQQQVNQRPRVRNSTVAELKARIAELEAELADARGGDHSGG